MQLLVFGFRLILLKGLDLSLLFQKSLFDGSHLFVTFQHLSQKVVRTSDRDARLDKEPHSLHNILSSDVVEGYLLLDFLFHS